MPQPPDNKSFAQAYNLKRSAKRFARGGQIGLSERKERLRAELLNQIAPQTEELSFDDDIDMDIPEETPEKPSRKDRIRDILTENRVNSLKKVDE